MTTLCLLLQFNYGYQVACVPVVDFVGKHYHRWWRRQKTTKEIRASSFQASLVFSSMIKCCWIGHFPVYFSLYFKERPSANLMRWYFLVYSYLTNFHTTDFVILRSVCGRAWTCGLGNGPVLESFGLTYINLSRNELRVKNRTIFDTEYVCTVYVWTADIKYNDHCSEGSNLGSRKEGWKNPKRERNSAWPCNC